MIKSYLWKFFNFLHKYIAAPRMIMGYKRFDGVFLPQTRISNTVDIIQAHKLNIANNVFIWHHSILDCSNGLTIHEGCQIGAYVLIATHSSHIAIRLYGKQYIKYNGQHIGYLRGSSIIGAYSFIGPHSVIMPGVTIGKGSIISSYSYVKGGVYPDFAILAGNPAKIVGDTRTLDQDFLLQHPYLEPYYQEWAKQKEFFTKP